MEKKEQRNTDVDLFLSVSANGFMRILLALQNLLTFSSLYLLLLALNSFTQHGL